MKLSAYQEILVGSIIELALKEDIGSGDHTTLACVPYGSQGSAHLLVKDEGVICGLEMASRICSVVDAEMEIHFLVQEGDRVAPGDEAFILKGQARSILTAERLMLNCMQRMSGIATYTRKLTELVKGTNAVLLDTRKTAPGMRVLEKWAVLTGGGQNHRMGLYDMIMIKDNHIDYAGGIAKAITRVHDYLHQHGLSLQIEIEARNFAEIDEILQVGGINRIMLDNFSPDEISQALPMINGKYETEASGGIDERNLREYAETGVDFISLGALTHNVKSLDLSLKAISSI